MDTINQISVITERGSDAVCAIVKLDNGESIKTGVCFKDWQYINVLAMKYEIWANEYWNDVPALLTVKIQEEAYRQYGYSLDEEALEKAVEEILATRMAKISMRSLFYKKCNKPFDEVNISCGKIRLVEVSPEADAIPDIYVLHLNDGTSKIYDGDCCLFVDKDTGGVTLETVHGKQFRLTLEEAAATEIDVSKFAEG